MAFLAKSLKRKFDNPDTTRIKLENYSSEHKNLLDLILNEDVEGVKRFFSRHQDFSINADRDFARAVLALAIDNNRDDIVEILLDKNVKVGGALFTAVREGSKDCVAKLLPHIKSERGDIGPEDVKEGAFVSPLMLAVHIEDIELIELLVSEGFKIKDPEDINEFESSGSGSISVDADFDYEVDGKNIIDAELKSQSYLHIPKERSFLLRVNSYRALANPLYIAYSYLRNKEDVHPIFRVFELNKKLKKQAMLDFEFKRNYEEYSEACERFAVDLLEQCHTVKEIQVLTDVLPEIVESYSEEQKYIEVDTKDAKELTVLNLAIRNDHDELVAHPYSQLRLNMVLYQDIYTMFNFEPPWRRRSFISRSLYGIRHTLLLPILTLLQVLAPDCRISKKMRNPVIKFISHTGSFCLFVILLILSSFQDKFDNRILTPTLLDWIIFTWVLGLFIQEIKELFLQGGQRYMNQWWNLVSLFMVGLFIFSYVLRFVAFGMSGKWTVLNTMTDFTPTSSFQTCLFSNSLFSCAMVLSFIHLSSAFQVSVMFGPLQLSLYRLVGDVLKFLMFFFLIFIAFGFSLRKLYSHYISTQRLIAQVLKGGKEGKLNVTTQPDTKHELSDVQSGLYSLFWSVFGLTELQTFETKDKTFLITKETGQLLFGFFQVLIVIIAMNMLIAMMTRSFDNIAENADVQWKVSRTRMWMNWVDKGSVLPPPFNLIPSQKIISQAIKSLFWLFCGKLRRCNEEAHSSNTYNVTRTNEAKEEAIGLSELSRSTLGRPEQNKRRRNTIKRIVARYIHKRKEEARQEDSEMLRDLKDMQEKMWKEMRQHFGLSLSSPRQKTRTSISQYESTLLENHMAKTSV